MRAATAPPGQKASFPVRGLHWLMSIIIISAWPLIYAKGLFAKGSFERDAVKQVHMIAGLTVFGFAPLRVAARWLWPLPEIEPSPAHWQIALAKIMHALLYAGMIGLPVLGVLFVQADGKTISALGFSLPTLIHPDKALAHGIKEVHETLGLGMLYLVVAHAGAALWHHYVQHDNTLKRMLLFRSTWNTVSPLRRSAKKKADHAAMDTIRLGVRLSACAGRLRAARAPG